MNEQSGVMERVLLRRDADGVAWLTLNRPGARNAFSLALMQALLDELDAVATDADGEGAGDRRRRPGVLRRPRPARAAVAARTARPIAPRSNSAPG